MAERWDGVPIVFVKREPCPWCGSAATPITVRSEQGGDGSVSRKSVCRLCSGRFMLVIELPDSGKCRQLEL